MRAQRVIEKLVRSVRRRAVRRLVADTGLEPGRFTLRTVRRRLSELDQAGDPWAGLTKRRYSLTKAETRLDELTRARLAASSCPQHR
jgi:hypothetical protein